MSLALATAGRCEPDNLQKIMQWGAVSKDVLEKKVEERTFVLLFPPPGYSDALYPADQILISDEYYLLNVCM